MPHESLKLVVEPRYPYQKLNGASLKDDDGPSDEIMRRCAEAFDFSQGNIFPINEWYDRRLRANVLVYHTGDHRSKFGIMPRTDDDRRLGMLVDTLAASQCWPLDAEIKACEKLRELITPTAYRYYVLTGMFIETSPRSRISYLFRKLRPTLALAGADQPVTRVIAALCLHPIGYYQRTFAGVMVPTDDVLAHLLMMRGDERKFWAKASQHAVHEIEAGF